MLRDRQRARPRRHAARHPGHRSPRSTRPSPRATTARKPSSSRHDPVRRRDQPRRLGRRARQQRGPGGRHHHRRPGAGLPLDLDTIAFAIPSDHRGATSPTASWPVRRATASSSARSATSASRPDARRTSAGQLGLEHHLRALRPDRADGLARRSAGIAPSSVITAIDSAIVDSARPWRRPAPVQAGRPGEGHLGHRQSTTHSATSPSPRAPPSKEIHSPAVGARPPGRQSSASMTRSGIAALLVKPRTWIAPYVALWIVRRTAAVSADRPRHLLLALGQDRGPRPPVLVYAAAGQALIRTPTVRVSLLPLSALGRAPQRVRMAGRAAPRRGIALASSALFVLLMAREAVAAIDRRARHAAHSVGAPPRVRRPDPGPAGLAVGRRLRAHRAAHRDLAAARRRPMARMRAGHCEPASRSARAS